MQEADGQTLPAFHQDLSRTTTQYPYGLITLLTECFGVIPKASEVRLATI